jgi:hypothetical protein
MELAGRLTGNRSTGVSVIVYITGDYVMDILPIDP